MSNHNHNGDFIPGMLLSVYSEEVISKNGIPNIDLTARELDICCLLAKGLNTKEIANRLSLSEHTVSTHRKKIIQKNGCRNTTHLVASCLKQGLI